MSMEAGLCVTDQFRILLKTLVYFSNLTTKQNTLYRLIWKWTHLFLFFNHEDFLVGANKNMQLKLQCCFRPIKKSFTNRNVGLVKRMFERFLFFSLTNGTRQYPCHNNEVFWTIQMVPLVTIINDNVGGGFPSNVCNIKMQVFTLKDIKKTKIL